MRTRQRSHPTFKLREDEQQLYRDFIDELNTDYDSLKDSDKRQVDLAAIEYILSIRLQQDELETGRIHLSSRFSHLSQMRALLNDIGLSRSARLKEKPVSTSAEDELREILFAVGREPTSQNGEKQVD